MLFTHLSHDFWTWFFIGKNETFISYFHTSVPPFLLLRGGVMGHGDTQKVPSPPRAVLKQLHSGERTKTFVSDRNNGAFPVPTLQRKLTRICLLGFSLPGRCPPLRLRLSSRIGAGPLGFVLRWSTITSVPNLWSVRIQTPVFLSESFCGKVRWLISFDSKVAP